MHCFVQASLDRKASKKHRKWIALFSQQYNQIIIWAVENNMKIFLFDKLIFREMEKAGNLLVVSYNYFIWN